LQHLELQVQIQIFFGPEPKPVLGDGLFGLLL
jgi:hypothetical protein